VSGLDLVRGCWQFFLASTAELRSRDRDAGTAPLGHGGR